MSLLIVTWLQTDKGAPWQRRLLHYRQVSIRHKHGPQMLSGPEKQTNKTTNPLAVKSIRTRLTKVVANVQSSPVSRHTRE